MFCIASGEYWRIILWRQNDITLPFSDNLFACFQILLAYSSSRDEHMEQQICINLTKINQETDAEINDGFEWNIAAVYHHPPDNKKDHQI